MTYCNCSDDCLDSLIRTDVQVSVAALRPSGVTAGEGGLEVAGRRKAEGCGGGVASAHHVLMNPN